MFFNILNNNIKLLDFLCQTYIIVNMKKISPFFSVISIMLCAAGVCGTVVSFWLTVQNFRNGEALKTTVVLALIFGILWAAACVIAGISAYGQAKKITALQRTVSQSKLDPRYSKTAKKAYRIRINYKQCRIRAFLIVIICLIQMTFICIIGTKIAPLVILAVCGIAVPFLFLISSKANS